jgi:hypothetical protein
MAVTRDYTVKDFGIQDAFVPDAGTTSVSTQSTGSNALLQGSIQRTSTSFGRTATVKAGEDYRPALESLRSVGGGTLLFLAGEHKINHIIQGFSGLTISGEGLGITILVGEGIRFWGDSLAPVENVTVTNLSLEDNISDALSFQYVKNLLVSNVSIKSPAANGIFCNGTFFCNFNNIDIQSAGQNGVYIITPADWNTRSLYFRGLSVSLCTLHGFYATNLNSSWSTSASLAFIFVSDSVFYNNLADGVRFLTTGSAVTQQVSLSNLVLSANSQSGLYLSLTFFSTISNCISTNNSLYNVYLNSFSMSLSGCVLGGTSSKDLYLDTSCERITVSGLVNATKDASRYVNLAATDFLNIESSIPLSLGFSQKIRSMKNTRGAFLMAGDVVVLDSATDEDGVTVTTTAGNDRVYGVSGGAGTNFYGDVLVEGKTTLLKVNGTTDIAVGDYLSTHTVAGIAAKAAPGHTVFAIALEAYTNNDSNGVIDALIITPRKI